MQSIQVNWEDEENSRVIELAVQYRIDSGAITIDGITPNRVHFLCPETGSSLRSIGVHGVKGRALVSRQFVEGGGFDSLLCRLEEKHGAVQIV